MSQNVESILKEMAEIREGFQSLGIQVMKGIEEQKLQIKQHGSVSDKLGSSMDGLSTKWAGIEAELNRLKSQITEMAAKQGREAFSGLAPDAMLGLNTLGLAFVSSSQYKSMVAERQYSSKKFDITGGIQHTPKGLMVSGELITKSVDLTSTQIGSLVERFRWDQVTQDPLRPPRVRDLLQRINISSDSIEYVAENVTLAIYSELTVEAAAAQKALVVGVNSDGRSKIRGWMVGQTVTVSLGEANEEDGVIASLNHTTGTITLVSNLSNTHVVGRSISATEFEATPEAEIKPTARIEFETIVSAVKTLATIIPFSKQMLMDSTAVQGLLSSRMEAMIELSEERQILRGDGTSNQYLGIMNHPDIQTYLMSSGLTGDSVLDAVRRSFTQVFLAFYPVDGVIFHPSDWEKIETLKGSDGHYIFNQVQVSPGVTTIWRATVIETAAMVLSQWLAGAFRLGAILWDRQQSTMDVSDQNKDWWERNMVGIRVEQRGDMSVIRPKSFVLGTFDGEPA